jgi:hypothetical protein
MAGARQVSWVVGGAAVAAGVVLFGMPMLLHGYQEALPENLRSLLWPGSPLLSPLFAGPVMGLAVWAGRLRLWGALALVAAVVVIHTGAVTAAIATYVPRMPPIEVFQRPGETPAARDARRAEDRRTAERAGALAGAAGGALGGAASLLLLGLVLRPRRPLLTALAGTVVLTGVGALGVSRLMAAGNAPGPVIWQAAGLNLLWQALLGATIVHMLRTPRGNLRPHETDLG